MSPFEIALIVYAAVLALAACGVVVRMIIGPTILDRALASDSLVTLVVMGMALYAAGAGAGWAGGAMLGLTGMAFIGTVTFARFVAREDPPTTDADRPRSRRRIETGVHVAIHPARTKLPTPEEAEDHSWEEGFGAEEGSRAFEDEAPDTDGPTGGAR